MKSSEVDQFRHISMNVETLKIICLWCYIPYPKRSVKFWLSILVRIFLGIFVFIIPTSGQIAYVAKLIMSGDADIQEVAGIVNLILTELLTSLKLLDLRLHRRQLTELMDQLISAEPRYFVRAHAPILERAVALSRRLFLCLLISASVDVAVHTVAVPAMHGFQTLPLKMDLIWLDMYDERYFSYACAYQILYKPTMLATFAAIETLTWAVMINTISQLDILIYNLEHMEELIETARAERRCGADEAFKEIFKRCLEQHRDVTRFVQSVQDTFGGQFSLTMVLCACIVGTTGVQMLSIGSPLKNITVVLWVLMYLCIIALVLFILCYFGNTITYKSLHLATVAFACPWVSLAKEHKKNLIIFIARSQQPLVLTAAKLVPVSLETFTKVMNWTYKGFAVMNQMKQ